MSVTSSLSTLGRVPALAAGGGQSGDKNPPSLDTNYGFPFRPVQDSVCDTSTGEIKDGYEVRVKRFELQNAARTLLPGQRVCVCLRHRRRDMAGVQVWRKATQATYYGGLQVCASVWTCPVCAAKISEGRRAELVAAVDTWKASTGSLVFLTLTVPHQATTEPFGLVNKLLALVESFNSGRNAMKYLVPGYVGQIRALEVTHGQHGWHPHVHVLVFLDQTPDMPNLWTLLWPRWSVLVASSGLGQPSPKAFGLQDGAAAARYASKWGVPEEMTKGQFKTAKSFNGRTPFALLASYLQGDKQAGALFVDFAKSFKGKRQLRWSLGLRNRLGLFQEKTDDEHAHQTDALDALLGTFTDRQWKAIRQRNLRAIVLEILRSGTWQDVLPLISDRVNP